MRVHTCTGRAWCCVLREALEKPFQQSVRRNRPVLRAQKYLGRICQKKLRNSLATSVLRGFILSSAFARRL